MLLIRAALRSASCPTKQINKWSNVTPLVINSTQQRGFAKKVFSRAKPHFNVGTIGHVDHGKTTLTAALTKVLSEKTSSKYATYEEIDSAPEELKRGITINATSVSYATKKRHFAHVDCPGHADYIKNMIVGSTNMDGAILVVAATDGVMPQTREHLLLAKQIGVKNVIVYINKCDATDSEVIELVELEVRELLDEMGFDGEKAPVIQGSALCELEDREPSLGRESIMKLAELLDNYIPEPERDLDRPFLLPIESTHQITGRGVVVTGKVACGVVSKGDPVEVLGYDSKLQSTVTGLEMFQQTLERGEAGDQLGALLRGIKREQVRRGMMVCQPGSMSLCNHIRCTVYLLSKEEGGLGKPLATGMYVRMFSETLDIESAVLDDKSDYHDKKMLMPGENGEFNMMLFKKMGFEKSQRFTLRTGDKTIGYGVCSELLPNMDVQQFMEARKAEKKAKEKAEKRAAASA